MSNANYEGIMSAALAAGAAAASDAMCDPMIISDGKTVWHVADGVCGFGWVEMPGNTAFGRWAKANGIARKGYPKGLTIWSKASTQSMTRNEAWAIAVAKVLRDNGIAASARSRID